MLKSLNFKIIKNVKRQLWLCGSITFGMCAWLHTHTHTHKHTHQTDRGFSQSAYASMWILLQLNDNVHYSKFQTKLTSPNCKCLQHVQSFSLLIIFDVSYAGLTPSRQWLLYVPPGVTFKHSTFCLQSVFVFLRILGKQLLSPHAIMTHWVFTSEAECVHCAFQTRFSKIF
jgi:hypothetical protein